jgi:Glycosyltransferase like family 2
VLALRWSDGGERGALAHYLESLSGWCGEVIVVDGSSAPIFAANAAAWSSSCVHLAPDPHRLCKMGKVAGVLTGVELARYEALVLADDDVRYGPTELRRVCELLQQHDLVRPQNFFSPLPWHARWDTARTLINRALGGDFPGTLAVRRSRMVAMGGYDGDVMFENLELIRTVEASGGSVATPLDLYVRRVPPSGEHFWGQRTRQAYDDFAVPARMCCWLTLVPGLATGIRRRSTGALLAALAGSVALAEYGRRRAGGARVFPASSSWLAPVWLLERGVCSWLAVLQRVRFGGIRYRDGVIATAAHSKRALRTRLADSQRRAAAGDRRGGESGVAGPGTHPAPLEDSVRG